MKNTDYRVIVGLGKTGYACARFLAAKNIPFVVINRNLDEPGLNLVKMDNVEIGRIATQHLIKLGHRRIATITAATH